MSLNLGMGQRVDGLLYSSPAPAKGQLAGFLPLPQKCGPRDEVCLMSCVLPLWCVGIVKILRTSAEYSLHTSKQFGEVGGNAFP